ncbi:MAG: hypothetical protein KAR11_00925 [Phycisphaerae bacterium]|nr:hypothetical protein [Phycisphaerae bacterium]
MGTDTNVKTRRGASGSMGLLETSPPREVFCSHLELRRVPSVLLLCLLTVVLLLISFPPFDCWFAAYFALVPWGLAMFGGVRRNWTLAAGWLTGLVFWAGSVYWLFFPTPVGYAGAVVYLSLYWLIASGMVRTSIRRALPMWFVLPVIWVGIEYIRSLVICFPWFFLSQTQHSCTSLIQISDITGQYGVSFFVAMVNGVIIDALSAPLFKISSRGPRINRNIATGFFAVLLTLAAMLSYGAYRLGQNTTTPGPVVGVVQEAVPITLSGRGVPIDEIFAMHLKRSLEFIGEDCDVIIWPETMLPPGLNTELLMVNVNDLDDDSVRAIAANLWGLRTTRENSPAKLRFYLTRAIGRWGGAQSYKIAAIKLLNGYVTPAQLEAIDPNAVRLIAAVLLGEQNTRNVSDSQLRGWCRLFVRNADTSTLSDADISSVYAMLNIPPREDITGLSHQQKIIAVRGTIAAMSKLKSLNIQRAITELCSLVVGCPIIAGGSSIHLNDSPTGWRDSWELRNSVMMFEFQAPLQPVYSKMHLVPFSEYVPFKYSAPKIHKILRWFVPEVMQQLSPGEDCTRFEIRRGDSKWEMITPVCFEGSVAGLCRKMVNAAPKGNLVMANLSNDGWFVYKGRDGQYVGTTEQSQHLCHYVFRAIENRIPVVRSVNTGISTMIDSNGKIKSILELRTEKYRKRTMVTGVMKVHTAVDTRRSIYSSIGDVFAVAVLVAIAGVISCFYWKKKNE